MYYDRGAWKFSEDEVDDAMSYFEEFVDGREGMRKAMEWCRDNTPGYAENSYKNRMGMLRRYFMELGHEIPFRAVYKHKEKVVIDYE